MKLIKYKACLLLSLTLLLSGCGEEFLDGAELDSTRPSTDFKTNVEVDDIVRGGYFNLHSPGNWGLLDTDLFRTIQSDVVEAKTFGVGSFSGNLRLDPFYLRDRNENDFQALTYLYRGGYNVIVSANNALEIFRQNGGAFNDENAAWEDRITGEALFLRAYAHFYLARVFAPPFSSDPNAPGIITWRKPPTSAVDLKSKSTVKETYEFIISDLKRAIQLLPETYNPSRDPATYADRAQRDAARALLAEVYFYMGAPYWTQGMEGDGGALEQINALLGPNNTKYPLETNNLDDVFSLNGTGLRSSETIFHVSFFLRNAWRTPRNSPVLSENATNRRRAFAFNKDILNSIGWADPVQAQLDRRYANWFQRYESGQDPIYRNDYVDAYNVWCRKFDRPVSNYTAYRSPQFLLMRATILLGSDNPRALADVNILRQRAGLLPLTGSLTQQQLDQEFMKELSFEGKRLMFLIAQKRNIPAGDRQGGDIPYNDMSLVMKSPLQEIERNPNIND